METPGEDPYLSGQYAIRFVKGMQEGKDPRYLKTISTLKHYAAYSVENWQGDSRHGFDAVVSDEDLVQTYLPAFEAGIKVGRVGSVMCSYNAVNGIPSCASPFLLQDILREQWGWDGYVVSDCDAVRDVYVGHKYKGTPAEAAGVCLKAGTDLDCGAFYGKNLGDAIQNNFVADEDLDKALIRLFTARLRLGMFDPWDQQPYLQYPPETIGHSDHVETALQSARESIVLLKNDAGILPLNATTTNKVAVLGPHFNATAQMIGNYYGELPPIVSPLEALQGAFDGQVVGMQGCEVNSMNRSGFADAAVAASSADVAVLVMGISGQIENEGNDRTEIGLPGVQEDFIEAIGNVQKKTVLVLLNGGPVDVSAAKANPNIVAIIEAFYPGMKGAEAIADVLFGKYNPSGRLPYTMHKKDFVDQIAMSDMSMTNYPGRTYRYFRGETVYPFGHGLSYTTFAYETEEVGMLPQNSSGVQYRVRVTNTGGLAGDVSVLAFISFKDSTIDFTCPQSQLFAFEKIHLLPSESKEIFFSATTLALRCYHLRSKRIGSPKGWYSVRIGETSREFLSSTETRLE
jgi:beta-glucosidase-like glycosyl hydrolase